MLSIDGFKLDIAQLLRVNNQISPSLIIKLLKNKKINLYSLVNQDEFGFLTCDFKSDIYPLKPHFINTC